MVETSKSRFVKLEIHPNPHHLLPDPIETYEAAVELAKQDFLVLPYIPADPVLAKRLEDIGCAAVMPLGAPIGSGQGLTTKEMIQTIIKESNIPVIVDAGIRSPSEAAQSMEMGCEAVLINSAIAAAENPTKMADAFQQSVKAGRLAFKAGLMPSTETAIASSPLTSFLSSWINSLPDWLDPYKWMHLTESSDLNAIEAAIYSKNPTIRELALLLFHQLKLS